MSTIPFCEALVLQTAGVSSRGLPHSPADTIRMVQVCGRHVIRAASTHIKLPLLSVDDAEGRGFFSVV